MCVCVVKTINNRSISRYTKGFPLIVLNCIFNICGYLEDRAVSLFRFKFDNGLDTLQRFLNVILLQCV